MESGLEGGLNMNRLFFLVPDLTMTKEIAQELEEAGVNESNVHVLGDASDLLQKSHLHEANLMQISDLLPSLRRGAFIGLAFSFILAGLYAYALPANMKANPFVLVGILFFGTLFGAWISSLIGISVKDPIVEKYDQYVKEGYFIMMVDSPSSKETELTRRVVNHHNEIRIISEGA